MSISIFTPTYNRAYILPQLYTSLQKQTCKDFIWIVIDDGSSDKTEEVVESWRKQNLIKIIYYKQENQGKPMAHNMGVQLATTELCVCVDSDDYLTDNAVEEILNTWDKISDQGPIGIIAFCAYPDGKALTTMKKDIQYSTLGKAVSKYGLKGDTMVIHRRDIVSKHVFPQFEGEKFVPEAYLGDLVDREGEFYFLKKPLRICTYLEDGYTNNLAKLLARNPKGYIAYINQRLRFDKEWKAKALNTIRYIGIYRASGQKGIIRNSVYPLITRIMYPFGILFYYYRYHKAVQELRQEKEINKKRL